MALIFDLPAAIASNGSIRFRPEDPIEVALQGVSVNVTLPLLPPLPRSVQFRGLQYTGRQENKEPGADVESLFGSSS